MFNEYKEITLLETMISLSSKKNLNFFSASMGAIFTYILSFKQIFKEALYI